MNVVVIVAGAVIAVLSVGWLGLRVQPRPFPAFDRAARHAGSVPMPDGLPAPVERFYRRIYGDRVPVIESAVLTGRARLRPVGRISLPGRFRFTHLAGRDYRHYIEATWLGIPVLRIDERYLDGESLIEIPIIGTDQGPKVEQAANLGLWAESLWFPAILLTDPRVRWEPIDDDTAALAVPFKNGHERFVVRFDPESGLPAWTESMRYQDSASREKTLWMNHWLGYREVGGYLTGAVGAATWMDDGKPWAVFTLEDAVYNADVSDYMRARGL